MIKLSNIGPAIAQLRSEAAWSQEALAATAAVSVRTIQRVEEGKPAAVETIAAIARALELTVEQLKNMALCLEAYPTMLRLNRASNGGHLVRAIRQAQGSTHTIHSDDRSIRNAALAVIGAASDWADILDDPATEGDAEANLNELIDDLQVAGGKLFHCRLPVDSEYRDPKGDPIVLDTVVFAVFENGSPQIVFEDEVEIALLGTDDTIDVVRKHE